MTDASAGGSSSDGYEIVVLEARAVDEMVGKIRVASGAETAAAAVDAWHAEHGLGKFEDRGHDQAVVGGTLMYLHDAPDGTLVPHAAYPDGTEKIYTDLAHAESLF
jgi:hypothetical protein